MARVALRAWLADAATVPVVAAGRAILERGARVPKSASSPPHNSIVVDLQCLQTESRNRGIGTYTRGLVQGLLDTGSGTVVGLLNDYMGLAENALTHEIRSHPSFQLAVFPTGGAMRVQTRSGRQAAAAQMTQFISAISPKAFIVPSSFHRDFEVVPYSHSHLATWKFLVVLHDLIPLEYPEKFLKTSTQTRRYHEQLGRVKSAHLLLCNSPETEESWQRLVGDHPPTVVIGGGGFVSKNEQASLTDRAGIVMLGGDSANKNLIEAIDGYGLLPLALQRTHPLTILGVRSRRLTRLLRRRATDCDVQVSLPGHVQSAQRDALLARSRALLSTSWAEGLGLPVIEASNFGTPALVPSASPMGRYAAATYRLGDVHDLSFQLRRLLYDDQVWTASSDHQSKRCKDATWQGVATRLLQALM